MVTLKDKFISHICGTKTICYDRDGGTIKEVPCESYDRNDKENSCHNWMENDYNTFLKSNFPDIIAESQQTRWDIFIVGFFITILGAIAVYITHTFGRKYIQNIGMYSSYLYVKYIIRSALAILGIGILLMFISFNSETLGTDRPMYKEWIEDFLSRTDDWYNVPEYRDKYYEDLTLPIEFDVGGGIILSSDSARPISEIKGSGRSFNYENDVVKNMEYNKAYVTIGASMGSFYIFVSIIYSIMVIPSFNKINTKTLDGCYYIGAICVSLVMFVLSFIMISLSVSNNTLNSQMSKYELYMESKYTNSGVQAENFTKDECNELESDIIRITTGVVACGWIFCAINIITIIHIIYMMKNKIPTRINLGKIGLFTFLCLFPLYIFILPNTAALINSSMTKIDLYCDKL